MTAASAPARRTWVALGVALVLVVLDQLTKNWALNSLDDGPQHLLWTLQFKLTFNSGMAFSQGEGSGMLIGAIALVVIVVLIVSLRRHRVPSRQWLIAVGLVIGGAAGNLLDRLFRGEGWLRGSVVDFIDLQWWPIFNVADMGIVVGGMWLVLASALAPPPTARDEAGGAVAEPDRQAEAADAASDAGE